MAVFSRIQAGGFEARDFALDVSRISAQNLVQERTSLSFHVVSAS